MSARRHDDRGVGGGPSIVDMDWNVGYDLDEWRRLAVELVGWALAGISVGSMKAWIDAGRRLHGSSTAPEDPLA